MTESVAGEAGTGASAPPRDRRGSAAVEAIVPRVLPLHPRLRTVMRLRAVVVAAVLGVIVSMFVSAMLDLSAFAAGSFACAAIVAAAVLLDAHARAAYARYRVTRMIDGVQVERGVIRQSLVFVPDLRIQHTEVNQGPLDRRWGMARLSIYTAATHYGAVGAPGLHYADALALRDELIGRSGVDVV